MAEYPFRKATLNGMALAPFSGVLQARRDHRGLLSWDAVLVSDALLQVDEAGTFVAQLADGRTATGEVIRRNTEIGAGPAGVTTTVTLLGNGDLAGLTEWE